MDEVLSKFKSNLSLPDVQAVTIAIEETLKQQNLQVTPATFTASLLSLLSAACLDDSAKSISKAANSSSSHHLYCMLCEMIPLLSPSFLSQRWSTFSHVLVQNCLLRRMNELDQLQIPASSENLNRKKSNSKSSSSNAKSLKETVEDLATGHVKWVLECLYRILVRMDSIFWKENLRAAYSSAPSDDADTSSSFVWILFSLCFDPRPKLRKKACEVVAKLTASPPRPMTRHPMLKPVLHFIKKSLESSFSLLLGNRGDTQNIIEGSQSQDFNQRIVACLNLLLSLLTMGSLKQQGDQSSLDSSEDYVILKAIRSDILSNLEKSIEKKLVSASTKICLINLFCAIPDFIFFSDDWESLYFGQVFQLIQSDPICLKHYWLSVKDKCRKAISFDVVVAQSLLRSALMTCDTLASSSESDISTCKQNMTLFFHGNMDKQYNLEIISQLLPVLLKSLRNWKYQKSLDFIISVCDILIKSMVNGPLPALSSSSLAGDEQKLLSIVSKVLRVLAEMVEDPSYSHLGSVIKVCFIDAMNVIKLDTLLAIVPLDLIQPMNFEITSPDNSSPSLTLNDKSVDLSSWKPKAWLLSWMPKNVKFVSSGFIAKIWFPMAKRVFSIISDEAINDSRRKLYESIYLQIWLCFPTLMEALMVEDSFTSVFESLASEWGRMINEETNGTIRFYLLQGFLQLVIRKGDSPLVQQFLQKFCRNFIPLFFNLYLCMNGPIDSMESDDKAQIILQVISEYGKCLEPGSLDSFLAAAFQKLAKALSQGEESEQLKLMDLIILLTPMCQKEELRANLITSIWMTFTNENSQIQAPFFKKIYKFLAILTLDDMKKYCCISSSSSSSSPSSADETTKSIHFFQIIVRHQRSQGLAFCKKNRLNLIAGKLIPSLQEDESDISWVKAVPELLAELVLALKECNEKVRDVSFLGIENLFHFFRRLGQKAIYVSMEDDTSIDDDDDGKVKLCLREFLTMLCAGLASNVPQMISSTILSLSRLFYDHYEDLKEVVDDEGNPLYHELLPAILVLAQGPSKEVVKSCLGFLKVCIVLEAKMIKMQQPKLLESNVVSNDDVEMIDKINDEDDNGKEEFLRPFLPEMIKVLLKWSSVQSCHFKLRIRHMLERLIRMYPIKELEALFPAEHKALLSATIKRKERQKRTQQQQQRNQKKKSTFETDIIGDESDISDQETEDANEENFGSKDQRWIETKFGHLEVGQHGQHNPTKHPKQQDFGLDEKEGPANLLDPQFLRKPLKKEAFNKKTKTNYIYQDDNKTGIQVDKSGKLIIKVDDDDDEKHEKGNNDDLERNENVEPLFSKSVATGKIQFRKEKRKLDDDADGSGDEFKDQNGKKKSVSSNNGRKIAKRKSDARRKGDKFEPYQYIPLKSALGGSRKSKKAKTQVISQLKN